MEKNTFVKNKKGTLIDAVFIGIFLLLLSTTILFSSKMSSELKSDIQKQPEVASDAAAMEISGRMDESYISKRWDSIFLYALVFLWIGALITGYLIESHPVFFVLNIVVLLIVLFISMILGNIYETIASDSEIVLEVARFPMMHWIMTHFLIVFLALCVTILISIFAKPK